VRVFGDTAVVTYIKEYRQTPDTSKFFNEDDTDVFTRDASGWHLRYTRIYRPDAIRVDFAVAASPLAG
jgi:hypothetical protein